MTTLEGQMGIPNTTKKLQRRLKEVEMFPVFHGTHPDTVPKIVEQGFNRDFSSINSRHGRGCYFATESEQSCFHTYSKPDSNGVQAVFVCRIIVGSFCRSVLDVPVVPRPLSQGHARHLGPAAARIESESALRHDSRQRDESVDLRDVQRPPGTIAALAAALTESAQAYPSYLVKFRARPNVD